ncbi:MAG: hypothetical protein MJ214_00890 [Bacilli bacterium]|nr:hypothetical protein [Bacilli bacterium]
MKNNIKVAINRANINFKKELTIILIINVFLVATMVVAFIFTKNNLLFIPFIFLIVLVNAVAFYRYLFLYSKNVTDQIKELTILLRYLYQDINNQVNVKDALMNLKERASLKMNQKLETFFTEIEKDQSLSPYLNLAKNFSSVLIEEVMISLYRYKENASKENLLHFNESYLKLKKVVDDDEERDNNRQYELVKATAIIGTAIIVMLVIIVTIIIVEEYVHG